MDNQVHNAIVSFIWGIADDCLRDVYVRGKYRDVILPMTVIRRLDAMLEDTKPAVLEMKEKLDKAGITNQWPALCNAAGQAFCNSSPFLLKDLTSRAKKQTLKVDFEAYLDGFSPNVQEILEKFKFRNQIDTMIDADILGAVIEKFVSPTINLSPKPVYTDDTMKTIKLPALDNHGMGTIFEELIRKFNEENNEEAGEHWTPRDVVDLMADLVIIPVADKIMDATYSCYDGACGTGGMLTVAQDRLMTVAKKRGKEVSIHLFGQELQPETYAICKADMLLKGDGEQAEHIAYGSTLSADGNASRQFDFMLANPPYGKSWKTDAEKMGGKRSFAESRGIFDKNDPELDSLSKDIMQEVHGDYYLASMIKKGVAYHIGYLPVSIRTRIEDLFQKGNITIMFCTSTLLEGVNLPADNLFITDNKIFKRKMNPVDFRNLIGRVGRISYNLYGNVFFVSDEKSVSSESYIEMLQEPIPEQELSIESNPQALKRIEKKYIAEILKSGSSEIPKRREDQSEESYVMMRKFGLILLRDIMAERDSLVHREFSDFLTVEDEQQIREKFNSSPTLPDDDINTSVDQTKRLIIAIKNGLEYPPSKNGFKYDDIIDFFNKLSKIFDWSIYEKSTLGNESKRKWYAVILSQWMEGSGLSYIMQRAIDYHKQHPENFRVSAYQPPTIYNDNSKEHRNVVFADTLEAIENIVLFSISNYFLRFSNEYKKIHGVDEFDNNWYEYVEFGTTNPLTILLQRNGFSRESATFIKKHKNEYVVHDGSTDELRLRLSLLNCGNTSVMTEAASIRFNAPKLFLEED